MRALKKLFRSLRRGPRPRFLREARRLELLGLEDRTVPTIVFTPAFGAESATDHGGDTLPDVPVYLIFWGQGWGTKANPSAAALDIENATDSLLSGPYLSRLSSYRSNLGHATFGIPGDPGHRAAWDASNPPNGFSWWDLRDVIGDHIDNGDLPQSDATGNEGLYLVVTPPGIQSDQGGAGGYHTIDYHFNSIWDPLDLVVVGWVGSSATATGGVSTDSVMNTLSHEVVESITDVMAGPNIPLVHTNGITVSHGANWTGGGDDEIADAEAQLYSYRLNGVLAQSYWSQVDNAYVVPDGHFQRFVVTSSVLTVNGDQLPNDDDAVIINFTSDGGVLVNLNGEVAAFDPGQISAITVNTGVGTDSVLVGRTLAGVPVTVNAGSSGSDTVNVGPFANNLDNVRGQVSVNGTGAAVTLTVFDQGNTADTTYTVTSSSVSVSRPGVPSIVYSGVQSVTLNGGGSTNTYNVQSASSGTAMTLNAGSGNDTIYFGDGNLGHMPAAPGTTAFTVNGQGGTDALIVQDQTLIAADTYTLDASSVSRSGSRGLSYSAVESLTLNAEGGNNAITISGSPSFPVAVNANGGNDAVTVQALGGPVTVNGLAGNDTLTVSLAGGTPLPAGGLTFNGGTGTNTLALQGTSGYNSESYTPSGPAAGGIRLTSSVLVIFPTPAPNISYTGVQSITDTLGLMPLPLGPLATIQPSCALNATGGADTVSVSNGGLVNGFVSLQVSGGGSFAPVKLANKTNVYLYGLGGADTITLNYSATAAGLSALLVDGGAAGDIINVQQTGANMPVTVNGGDGDDTVNLGNNDATTLPHGLDAVRSPITVNGQGGTNDIVNLLDATATYGDAYTISDTTVTRPFFGPAPAGSPTGLTYGTIEGLVLQAETGSNTVTVTNVAPATPVTVSDNGGTDTLVGPDFVTTWNLDSTGVNALDVQLSSTTTGRVNFSGVENLTGGGDNDIFHFAAGAAVSGRIDGGGGTNMLDYSDYVSPPAPGYGGPGVSVTLADLPAVGTATGTGGVSNVQNVTASRGDDHITGNGANNVIVSYGGVDVLAGGDGTDSFTLYGQQYTGSSVDGGPGTDTIRGRNNDNSWDLTGLNAGAVTDAYGTCTYANVENLTGGTHSDTFHFLSAAAGIAGTLHGNTGTDWLDYSLFPGAVTVNLETGSATGVAGGAAGRIRFMENVLGARGFANTLTGASTPSAGNPAVNVLSNTLSSVLVGGTRADVLTAGAGNSLLIGDGGADQLIANAGTPGFDILIGGVTDFDTYSANNLAALEAFAAAWRNTTGANYGAQVALLRDTGVVVNATTYRLDGSSVHNDAGAADALTGATIAQTALDWFFTSTNDVVQNVKASEVQTPIP